MRIHEIFTPRDGQGPEVEVLDYINDVVLFVDKLRNENKILETKIFTNRYTNNFDSVVNHYEENRMK